MTTLCVTSSLTLVALGGSDPTSGFRLETLLRPLSNHGGVLDMIAIYRDVEHASCEELGGT
jgi:hypothetical protein